MQQGPQFSGYMSVLSDANAIKRTAMDFVAACAHALDSLDTPVSVWDIILPEKKSLLSPLPQLKKEN